MSKTYTMRGSAVAIAVAAAGFFLGSISPSVAEAIKPQNGVYYVRTEIISLTGNGGVTNAQCAEAYESAGNFNNAVGDINLSGSVPEFTLRQPIYPSSVSLGVEEEVLHPIPGSTLTKQSGTIKLYNYGHLAGTVSYTATGTVYDTQSFELKVTIIAPSPTGKGTCTQVSDNAAMI